MPAPCLGGLTLTVIRPTRPGWLGGQSKTGLRAAGTPSSRRQGPHPVVGRAGLVAGHPLHPRAGHLCGLAHSPAHWVLARPPASSGGQGQSQAHGQSNLCLDWLRLRVVHQTWPSFVCPVWEGGCQREIRGFRKAQSCPQGPEHAPLTLRVRGRPSDVPGTQNKEARTPLPHAASSVPTPTPPAWPLAC